MRPEIKKLINYVKKNPEKFQIFDQIFHYNRITDGHVLMGEEEVRRYSYGFPGIKLAEDEIPAIRAAVALITMQEKTANAKYTAQKQENFLNQLAGLK